MKEQLENLKNSLPEIKFLEVGLNIDSSPDAYDIVLYSAFNSLDVLKTYQDHPGHTAFKKYIKHIRSGKKLWITLFEIFCIRSIVKKDISLWI